MKYYNNYLHKKHLSSRSEHISSNLALVIVDSMCFGPSAVAVMNGKLQHRKLFEEINKKVKLPKEDPTA